MIRVHLADCYHTAQHQVGLFADLAAAARACRALDEHDMFEGQNIIAEDEEGTLVAIWEGHWTPEEEDE